MSYLIVFGLIAYTIGVFIGILIGRDSKKII